jgi:hypothetical protein
VYVVRFFAGFCLAANGLYLAVGSLTDAGDAGDLLELGAPMWSLWLFGVAATAAGLYLWHGLGPSFGLGRGEGRVEPSAAWTVSGAAGVVIAGELALAAGG